MTSEELRARQERYNALLAEILANSIHVSITPEENDQIRADINKGMPEFCCAMRKATAETEMEFRTLHVGGYNPL